MMNKQINRIIKLEPRIRKAFVILMLNLKTDFFKYSDAEKLLNKYAVKKTNEVLSILANSGLITLSKDNTDKRIKIYKIKPLDFTQFTFNSIMELGEVILDKDFVLIIVNLKLKIRNITNLSKKQSKKLLQKWEEFIEKPSHDLLTRIYDDLFNKEYNDYLTIIKKRNFDNIFFIKFFLEVINNVDSTTLMPYSIKNDIEIEMLISGLLFNNINPSSLTELPVGDFAYSINLIKTFKILNVNKLLLHDKDKISLYRNKICLEMIGFNRSQLIQQNCLIPEKIISTDYVIAHPPWNQKLSKEYETHLKSSEHIHCYGIPPLYNMDWGWIQSALSITIKKALIFIDIKSLERGAREYEIRKNIINDDLIEAIISFKDTNKIILVINKLKEEDRKGKILFIKFGNNNYSKLIDAYFNPEYYKKIAKLFDIKDLDFTNLRPDFYIKENNLEKEVNEQNELFLQFDYDIGDSIIKNNYQTLIQNNHELDNFINSTSNFKQHSSYSLNIDNKFSTDFNANNFILQNNRNIGYLSYIDSQIQRHKEEIIRLKMLKNSLINFQALINISNK